MMTSCLLFPFPNLHHAKNYASRALAVDDDGQLPPMTVTNLTRMVGNLAGSVKVRIGVLSSALKY